MSEKMGVTRATAIACANAAVLHLKLGLFMSEFNAIDEQNLRFSKFAGNARYALSGRTNSGQWVLVNVTVLYKQDRSGDFPIDRACVMVTTDPKEPSHYLVCTFNGAEFNFEKAHPSVLAEDGHRPVWQTDESPDAWATRYHH